MNRRNSLAFLVAFLVIVGALVRTFTNRRALNRRLYDNLVESGSRDDRYINVLRAYADLRGPIDKRRICLETPFRDDCINILVLDSDNEGALKSAPARPWLRELRLNALTLRPNLILVDARLLDFLTEAMHTTLTAAAAHLIADGQEAEAMKTALAQASYAEFANLQEYYHPRSFPNDWRTMPIWKMADSSLKSFNKYAGSTSLQANRMHAYRVIVFAILLEHEIAHLDAGDSFRWAFSVKSTVERAASSIAYEEELRADRIALDRAMQMVESLRRSTETAPTQIDRIFQDEFFGNLPFLAYAGFVEDMALYDGLEGFRGLPARDLAVSLFHKNCEDPDDPMLSVLGFNAQDRVLFAARKPLPILTQEEFSLLRSKLAGAELAQTHRHNLIRVEEILARIKLMPKFVDAENPRQGDYINALLEDQPSLAFADKSRFVPIPGTDMNHIVEKAANWATLEPAVMCPLERCYVGRFPNGDGYFEIIGTARLLAEMRFVYNVHPLWDVPQGEKDAERRAMDSYMLSTRQMVAFFRLLAKKGEDPLRVGLMAGYLRLPMMRCGLGSQQVEEGRILYRSHSLSKPGWIEITARSATRSDLP